MDCVKNLTSCAGCTRKHARCHWRDVSREELGNLDMNMEASYNLGDDGDGYGYTNGHDESDDDDDSNPLEDLEALEEQEEGLRNARELSRMGWEEGIKSVTADNTDGQIEPQHVPTNGQPEERAEHASPQDISPRSQHHRDATGVGAEQQALATASESHSTAAAHASPGATKQASPAAAPPVASEEYRPSFGGFRAVNGAGGNVGGWRD